MKRDTRYYQQHGLLRIFLSYFGPHRRLFLLDMLCALFIGAVDLIFPLISRRAINTMLPAHAYHTFFVVMGIMAAAYLVRAFFYYIIAYYGHTFGIRVEADIRRDLFEHVQTLPLQFFDSRRHGDIMSLFTNDIDTMADALNNSFAMVIQSFIQIVGTLTLLYILNWRLSLIVTVCYGIMFWYIKFSGKRSKGYYTKQQNSLGELNGYIEELITGQKVVKVFHHEEESFTEFCKKNEELRKAGTGAQGYAATMVPVVVSISYVNYAIVAVLGGLLALHGKADIGSLASYLVFVRQAALPINQFTQQSNFLLSALAGAERVFDVMSLEPEIDEGKVELVNVKEENGALAVCEETTGRWAWKRPDGTMTELKGDVRFENVDFGYTADRLILKNISLYAKPGQKIAFVGSTGAGKTTITNLINRFYDVQGGAVVYDGIDVKDIEKDALRHSLGIVLQDTHLFTGTVAENIRFGKLDATQEEIERAAKIANADSFIRRLPNGYDTMLTSDGANLSQGQRQLLAIARAAVADPPVLILDEATSSVDTRTEALIEKGMDQLMEGRTVFVIAHRLSTVRNANAIMVLEQGNIVERGDHDALLAQKGKYYQLYHGMFELS